MVFDHVQENAAPLAGREREREEEMERLREEKGVLIAAVQDLREGKRRAEVELRGMRNKLQASDKEKSRLQYELHLLNKKLQIRGQEKEMSASGEVVEEAECELFRGLMAKEEEEDDQISCAESWASALLWELDYFKPRSGESEGIVGIVSEIMRVVEPVAVQMKVETAGVVQAKEKVMASTQVQQDHAHLLHFLQHLSSILPSILQPSPHPLPQTNLQLELGQLHDQIQGLNKDLQSQTNHCQHLSAVNEKLHKQLEAYKKEKNKVNECRSVVGGYEEKERRKGVGGVFRRLFCCASSI